VATITTEWIGGKGIVAVKIAKIASGASWIAFPIQSLRGSATKMLSVAGVWTTCKDVWRRGKEDNSTVDGARVVISAQMTALRKMLMTV
jgi:D-arabinose 1-dehydrogenase-like Zn-dependent alcohol dehydrogenase